MTDWIDFTPNTKLRSGTVCLVQDDSLDCDCCGIEATFDNGAWWQYGKYLSLNVKREVKNVVRYTTGPLSKCTSPDCPCNDSSEESEPQMTAEFQNDCAVNSIQPGLDLIIRERLKFVDENKDLFLRDQKSQRDYATLVLDSGRRSGKKMYAALNENDLIIIAASAEEAVLLRDVLVELKTDKTVFSIEEFSRSVLHDDVAAALKKQCGVIVPSASRIDVAHFRLMCNIIYSCNPTALIVALEVPGQFAADYKRL